MDTTIESTTTIIALLTRKPGTTFEHFKSYYENHHAPLVVKLLMQGEFRPLSYTRHYVDRGGGDLDGQPAPSFPFGDVEHWEYDCLARSVFRDTGHRDAFFAEFKRHRETIARDEAEFLDVSKLRVIYITESISNVRKG